MGWKPLPPRPGEACRFEPVAPHAGISDTRGPGPPGERGRRSCGGLGVGLGELLTPSSPPPRYPGDERRTSLSCAEASRKIQHKLCLASSRVDVSPPVPRAMMSPGLRSMTSPRASSAEAPSLRSRQMGFCVRTSILKPPPSSREIRKWSRLRNCRHSFSTAFRNSSGWCFRPTKSGRCAKVMGPMQRSSSGTSFTFAPVSSRTISRPLASSGLSAAFDAQALAGVGVSGEAAGRGGKPSIRGLLGEDVVLPGGLEGEGPEVQAGGRSGDGGMQSGSEGNHDPEPALSPPPPAFALAGELTELSGRVFSGEASEDGYEGTRSETALVDAKEELRTTPPG
mmetsp:Transcript_92354/g.234743  ORF Transcript_92354/g.234743 Transcript_92354/m.234743 type:complete len:339 (+) Transcript_92354:301-1317(+)